ncbi:MAG: helix-turn-helix transcriptional regulator [Burkholderiales bacterium]
MDQASDDFVYTLYGAVLDADQWPVVTTKLAVLADAPHCGIFDSDFAAGVVHRQTLHGIDEALNRKYMLEYASIDPRVPVALGHNKLTWLSDHEYFEEDFRNKDRFYQEYMRPNGGGESIMSVFAKEGTRMGTAVVIRSISSEKLGAAFRHRLDAVTPHLDRAVKLSRRFAAIASEAILGHTVLDALTEPLACATSDGHLHRANLAFEDTLRSGHVLFMEKGALRIGDPALQVQFVRAIRECCRIAEGGSSGDPEAQFTIRVDQLTGLPAFVTIAPLAAAHLKSWAGRPCALIRIDEPVQKADDGKLIEALGLSVAEARLVSALLEGGTLAEAAARVNVALNTAKTQLASVFSKTGTTRQSELVALVASLPRKR